MNCEQARRLLSWETPGASTSLTPALHRHLESCPGCRLFWQALCTIDEDLAARPLAIAAEPLLEPVMRAVERRRPSPHMAPPFSRAFWALGAVLTLCALVSGALLLHYCASTYAWDRAPVLVGITLSPAWPNAASAWLSLQGERLAQFVLATLAGLLITLASVALGLRASEGPTRQAATDRKRNLPQR